MAFGVRRRQRVWDCWFGDRAMFGRVLETFDTQIAATAVATTPASEGRAAATATSSERGGAEPRAGEWEALLDEADLDALDRFSIAVAASASESVGDLRLEFSRADGVVLRAGAADPEQIRRAVAVLSPAIEPGVPDWSWIHSQAAELVAAVILGIVVELVWLVASNHLANPDVLDFLPLPLGVLVAFGVVTILHRWIPRFRVREQEVGEA